jgi:hypothetical protein
MEDPTSRLLKAILRSIGSLKASLGKEAEAIAENTKTQNTERPPKSIPESQIEVRLPVAIDEYCKSQSDEQARQAKRDSARLRIEIVTLIAAIVLGVLAYWTMQETRNQVTVMRQQLEATDRPWIKVTRAQPLDDLIFTVVAMTDGSERYAAKLAVRIFVKNFGRSVALKSFVRGQMTFTQGQEDLLKEQELVCSSPTSWVRPINIYPEEKDGWLLFIGVTPIPQRPVSEGAQRSASISPHFI